jgi:parvulin-like peptidyl-prolyl isomerase
VSTVDGEPILLSEVEEVVRATGLPPRRALQRLQDERVLAHLAEAHLDEVPREASEAARRAAVRALLAQEIEATHTPEAVRTEDLERRAAELRDGLSAPEMRRASHALVPLRADAREETVDAAMRLATRIRDELRDEAAPAAALDRFAGPRGAFTVEVEHLAPLGRDGLVTPFADALFGASAPGLLDTIVRTSFGLHVVVLEEIVPPWEVPREEWEPVLRRQLAIEARARATEELARRLSASTTVAIDPRVAELATTVGLEAGRFSGEP